MTREQLLRSIARDLLVLAEKAAGKQPNESVSIIRTTEGPELLLIDHHYPDAGAGTVTTVDLQTVKDAILRRAAHAQET